MTGGLCGQGVDRSPGRPQPGAGAGGFQQKGCLSEKLLRCRDAPEFISYSEWESEAAIEAYRNSDTHKKIVRHTRGLKGAKAEVKLYDLVQ